MGRGVLIGCGFILVAVLAGCSRDPGSRRNPVDEPQQEANLGDVGAQFELGVRITNGPGASPDYPQAAAWFRRAAEQGHPGARAALGFIYYSGRGVPRNDVEAYKWLSLAAWQPSPERDAYALWREYVARQMNSAQIAEGEKLAREWTKSQ